MTCDIPAVTNGIIITYATKFLIYIVSTRIPKDVSERYFANSQILVVIFDYKFKSRPALIQLFWVVDAVMHCNNSNNNSNNNNNKNNNFKIGQTQHL